MALENGVDVFDSSCAYSATEKGCAVTFPVEHQTHGGQQQVEQERGSNSCDLDDKKELLPFQINLNDERYYALYTV